MKMKLIIGFFSLVLSGFLSAQPSNDNCSNAERLCPNVVLNGTTEGATVELSSDYNFCFTPDATVWYLFTTDSDGGTVTVEVSNLVFNPDVNMGQQLESHIIAATTPCSIPSYTPLSACGGGATDFSVTSAIALDPNTTYYFLINGTNSGATLPAECDFQITISGDGVEQTIPSASISATNTTLCFGDTEIVSSTITNAADTLNFNWYFNNALISSSPTASEFNVGTLSGDGYLKLIFESGDLCIVSDTTDSIYFEITPIAADAGPDKFIGTGEQTTLDGVGVGDPLWAPGSSLTSTTSYTPIATPSTTTTYFLTVTNESCVATDSATVYVGEVITIYSSFTPNDDNINDKWIIRNSAQFENMQITVYDRSGQIVFESTGYSDSEKWWDGTLKNDGKPLPASTYFYVIDLKEGDYPVYKGSVTIIR